MHTCRHIYMHAYCFALDCVKCLPFSYRALFIYRRLNTRVDSFAVVLLPRHRICLTYTHLCKCIYVYYLLLCHSAGRCGSYLVCWRCLWGYVDMQWMKYKALQNIYRNSTLVECCCCLSGLNSSQRLRMYVYVNTLQISCIFPSRFYYRIKYTLREEINSILQYFIINTWSDFYKIILN